MKRLVLCVVVVGTLVGTGQADTIVSWGANFYGQLSNIPTGDDFTAISAGWGFSLALRSDGSIAAWGEWDDDGQVSGAPTDTGYLAIAARSQGLALRLDRSIAAWGNDDAGQASAPPGTGYSSISAGFRHSLALRSNGSIAAWGSDSHGQASAPTGTGYLAIAAGSEHSTALASDGSIAAWGWDAFGQVSGAPTGTFSAVASRANFSLALNPIPEPSTVASLLSLGIVGLIGFWYRRRKS